MATRNIESIELPDKIAFVDVETTGGSSIRDRVIEIGVVRWENGSVIRSWQSLVDPQTYIPPEITSLTGIHPDDLISAPTFRQISEELAPILDGCLFCAHNVRFDYSFLRNEFRRIGMEFKPKQLCTVRLSRQLFPREHHHNLDAIIGRFGISIQNRHRALDDADAIRQFYEMILKTTDIPILATAIRSLTAHPSAPGNLASGVFDTLPEAPGVYIFYGSTGMPIYIGKSINIRTRVLSHFSSDITDPKEMTLSSETTRIETEETDGEFGALLRESELIKQLKPLYNRQLRQTEQLFFISEETDSSGYKQAKIRECAEPPEGTIGIARSRKKAEEFLRDTGRKHNLCEKLLGIEKIRTTCFQSDLGICRACSHTEPPLSYNMRFSEAFAKSRFPAWPFNGAIIITEGMRSYIFDRWHFIGQALDETWTEDRQPFSLDIFNILRRYIGNTYNHRHIRVIERTPSTKQFAYPELQEVE